MKIIQGIRKMGDRTILMSNGNKVSENNVTETQLEIKTN